MEADAITYECPGETDILVTVNFTVLGMSSTIFNGSENSVQVMIGGTAPPQILSAEQTLQFRLFQVGTVLALLSRTCSINSVIRRSLHLEYSW